MASINVLLAAGHVGVFVVTGSHLVLAQGADSLLDVAVAAVLAIAATVAARPRDANHPFGHNRAEPIGALISAVLAGVLSMEVARSALAAAFTREVPAIDASVLIVFGAKFATKGAFLALVATRTREVVPKSPVVDAMVSDSRNDLAAIAASTVAYFAMRRGIPHVDTACALALCIYIAHNGLSLFRDSLRYLMGEAPKASVLAELRAVGAAVPGVHSVGDLLAHYVGNRLHVEIAVTVDAGLTAPQSHDIGERVQHAMEAVPVVARAFVHVDTLSQTESVRTVDEAPAANRRCL